MPVTAGLPGEKSLQKKRYYETVPGSRKKYIPDCQEDGKETKKMRGEAALNPRVPGRERESVHPGGEIV